MKTILRTFLAMSLFGAMRASAQSIAFITNMKGEIALDGNPRPTLLAELAKGQKIALGEDSQASVMFVASGKEYALKGPGQFVVSDAQMSATSGAAPTARDTPSSPRCISSDRHGTMRPKAPGPARWSPGRCWKRSRPMARP